LRYRYVRNALKRLKGDGTWERELQVLEDSDVRALNECVLTKEEAEQRQAVHDYEDIAEEGGVAAFGVVRSVRDGARCHGSGTQPNPKTRARRSSWKVREPNTLIQTILTRF
jgi:hypothetical protein